MLEEERLNLTSELKSLQGGRMESDRGRKRAEGQLQELSARLGQADREREEREERLLKLQVGPWGGGLQHRRYEALDSSSSRPLQLRLRLS